MSFLSSLNSSRFLDGFEPSMFLDHSRYAEKVMDACSLACCNRADGEALAPEVVQDLAMGFKALGDPHRVAVIDLLLRAAEPVCVVDIERHLPLAQSTVSYHLKFLVDAGVLDRERRGRWMYYTVQPERLGQLQEALAGFVETSQINV